ncbi:hypothetical protein OG266_38175 [Streptomyces sp. NBC_00554]|uniref:hypothetical protein n=1 Tax=Streptomyces sp. NBC_00554 TaxID=2903661 RepID=UPI00352CD078|nr:hypothetical protein OG266_38175 [Streptomyces sp. NBC_00554]
MPARPRSAAVRDFTSEALGRWRGWSESVSTALLGNWADPLHDEGQLTPGALDRLKVEASVVHRQLAPVWSREANGSRLLLLDTPLGDELTLYDLVPGRLDADSGVEGFDDPRLNEILGALSPAERAVTLAMSLRGVSSWAEAALAAGVAQKEVFGERVRRKVKRLAARITGSSPETGGIPGHGR